MTTFTAAEIASLAGTTPKRMRSFIRAQAEKGNEIVAPVGSGARYAFTAVEAHALVEAFAVRHISSGRPSQRDVDTLRALLSDALDESDDDDESDALDDEGDESDDDA